MQLQSEIQSLITRFATDVEAIVRNAAVAAVTDALGGDVASAVPRVAAKAAAPRKVAKRDTVATTAKAKPAVARAVRVRRSADDIEATATKIVDYVKANQGSKAEQIKAALKLPSNQWSAPVKVALESKRLTVRGEKRASAYSVPGGAVPPIRRAAK